MNRNLIMMAGVAMALAGCSSASSMLDSKSNLPQASAVQVRNNLALPPDLQLATPSGVTDRYQPNGYVPPIAQPVPHPVSQAAEFANPQAPQPASGLQGGQKVATAYYAPTDPIYSNGVVEQAFPADYYAKYGISRFKANGKLKTVDELKEELKQVVLKKKREENPDYGTIGNWGNMVSGKDAVIMHP